MKEAMMDNTQDATTHGKSVRVKSPLTDNVPVELGHRDFWDRISTSAHSAYRRRVQIRCGLDVEDPATLSLADNEEIVLMAIADATKSLEIVTRSDVVTALEWDSENGLARFDRTLTALQKRGLVDVTDQVIVHSRESYLRGDSSAVDECDAKQPSHDIELAPDDPRVIARDSLRAKMLDNENRIMTIINEHWTEFGHGPSYSVISLALGHIGSGHTLRDKVQHHIHRMRDRGLLEQTELGVRVVTPASPES